MRVMLIDPFYNNGSVPPNYSLGEIEKELLGNNQIMVEDFVSEKKYVSIKEFRYDEDEFIEKIKKDVMTFRPQVVYITTSYGIPIKQKPVLPRVRRILEEIRMYKVDTYIGGMGINVISESIGYKDREILSGATWVVGDEIQFVKMIAEKYDLSLSDEKIIKWENWEKNKYPRYFSVMSAKGCPSRCTFCMENKVYNGKYIVHDIQSIYDNIKYFYDKGYTKFAIEDSSFLYNQQYKLFCQMLIENNIKISWTCYAKTTQIYNNPEAVSLLKKAGCTSIIMGIETLDNQLLTKLQKGILNSETEVAIKYLNDAGIQVQGCFMLGLEGQDLASIISNIEYANSLHLLSYRWHIFQRNLSDIYSKDVSECAKIYCDLQLNVPDSCLEEYIGELEDLSLYFNEEHFLVRCLPYVKNSSVMGKYKVIDTMLTYQNIFDELKQRTKMSTYDEEEMYLLI